MYNMVPTVNMIFRKFKQQSPYIYKETATAEYVTSLSSHYTVNLSKRL
jgi:hypothetical protein